MAAVDSKEEHLDILLDVLNEHYKNRELKEAQVSTTVDVPGYARNMVDSGHSVRRK